MKKIKITAKLYRTLTSKVVSSPWRSWHEAGWHDCQIRVFLCTTLCYNRSEVLIITFTTIVAHCKKLPSFWNLNNSIIYDFMYIWDTCIFSIFFQKLRFFFLYLVACVRFLRFLSFLLNEEYPGWCLKISIWRESRHLDVCWWNVWSDSTFEREYWVMTHCSTVVVEPTM